MQKVLHPVGVRVSSLSDSDTEDELPMDSGKEVSMDISVEEKSEQSTTSVEEKAKAKFVKP